MEVGEKLVHASQRLLGKTSTQQQKTETKGKELKQTSKYSLLRNYKTT